MEEKWNRYARTRIATYIIVHREETRGSGKGGVIVDSTDTSLGQRVQDVVGSTRKNVKPRECRQAGRKTCLHGLYYRRVVRGSKMVDCAILRDMSLRADRMLSHRASICKLNEVRKQKRSMENGG